MAVEERSNLFDRPSQSSQPIDYPLDGIHLERYSFGRELGGRVTDQFGAWWDTLSEDEQIAIAAVVRVLEQVGPALTRPYADAVRGSSHPNMRELRIQCQGRPYRLLYAFDPRRVAILLIGGDKSGDKRWYDTFVPIADKLYNEHLQEIKDETESRRRE